MMVPEAVADRALETLRHVEAAGADLPDLTRIGTRVNAIIMLSLYFVGQIQLAAGTSTLPRDTRS